jgi:hypothetical protein
MLCKQNFKVIKLQRIKQTMLSCQKAPQLADKKATVTETAKAVKEVKSVVSEEKPKAKKAEEVPACSCGSGKDGSARSRST